MPACAYSTYYRGLPDEAKRQYNAKLDKIGTAMGRSVCYHARSTAWRLRYVEAVLETLA